MRVARLLCAAILLALPLAARGQAGMTVNVCAAGTTTTFMPCSNASFVDDRHYVATIRAAIGYYDAQGNYHVHTVDATQEFSMPPFSGNGFNFCLPVFIPGAVSISGISANVRVLVTLRYGIHGVFTFTYDGTGSGPGSSLTVTTTRKGQQIVEPGLSQCYGLLPDYETRPPPDPTVPPPPPPGPAPSCYYTWQSYSALWGTDYDLSYNEAVNECARSGGMIPSIDDMVRDLGSLNLTGSQCYWLSNLHNGNRVWVRPSDGALGYGGSQCRVLCKRLGCPASTPGPVKVDAVAPVQDAQVVPQPAPVPNAVTDAVE